MDGDIVFDTDGTDSVFVMQESYGVLDNVVKILIEYPQLNIEIIGKINTDGLNLVKDTEVSKKRADAIKNYLVSKGISDSKIITRGSTKKELLKQLDDQNKRNRTIFPKCEIKINSIK